MSPPALEFTLEAAIGAPAAEVFALLTTPERLPEIHPLVVDVRVEPPTTDGVVRFRVQDRMLLLGLFPLRFWYSVEMRASPAEGRAVFTSLASPNVTTRTEYELREEGGRTRLRERTALTAPRLLRAFVLRSAREAHERTLRTIEERFGKSNQG